MASYSLVFVSVSHRPHFFYRTVMNFTHFVSVARLPAQEEKTFCALLPVGQNVLRVINKTIQEMLTSEVMKKLLHAVSVLTAASWYSSATS